MPIGLVSDEDLQRELNNLSGSHKKEPHSDKVIEGTVLPAHPQGRREGDTNVPDSLRKIIGETAVIDGRQEALQLGAMFGVSPSQVSAYAKGATSTATYDSPSKSIISHINKSRQRAIKKASKVLNAAMGAITQEKLDYADVSDLSGIAKDMSVIIKNLEPKHEAPQEGDGKQTPQFVIFAPQFRDERTFEHITVQE